MPDEPNEPNLPDDQQESTGESSDAPAGSPNAAGDLSQADIDAALNQASAGDPAPPPSDDDAGGTLSQADIDAAMAGGAGETGDAGAEESTTQASADEPGSPSDAEADAGGTLSQADIDAAVAGGAGDSGSASSEEPATPASTGAVSQTDVDAAVSGTGDLSQADIDAALASGGGTPATSEPAASDATQAASAEAESPQDEINELLAAAESLASPDGADASAPEEVLLDSAGRPFDEAAAAMAAAIAEDSAVAPEAAAPSPEPAATAEPTPTPFELKDFSADTLTEGPHDISILRDVDLKVHIELGRTRMYIEDVLKLSEGSVVELNNLAGDPVNIYVNDRLVARGEVLVLSDNFCVRISEILSGPQNVAVA